MRRVRLDIDGFASYKGKTVIDFSDVDFLALVGPTGSGKSTICSRRVARTCGCRTSDSASN